MYTVCQIYVNKAGGGGKQNFLDGSDLQNPHKPAIETDFYLLSGVK